MAPVIYHCDLESQYEDLVECQKGNILHHVKEYRERRAAREAAVVLSQDSLFMRYLAEHVRQTLAPGAVLALPLDLVCEAACILEAFAMETDLQGDIVYVQVVLLNPFKMKTVSGADASRVTPESMLITPLAVCEGLQGESVKLVGQRPPAMFLFDFLHPANTREVWTQVRVYRAEASSLVLKGWEGDPEACHLLYQFVSHGALPRSGKTCLVPAERAKRPPFSTLQEQLYVSAELGSGDISAPCSLTERGVDNILSCKQVVPLRHVVERESTTTDEMSSFELLSLVLEKGWQWRHPGQRRLLCYQPGDEKHFFSRNKSLPTSYLRCLLKVDECQDTDTRLFHCQNVAYYESFLAGTAGNQPPAKRARRAPPQFLEGGDGENIFDLAGPLPFAQNMEEPLDVSLLEEMMNNMEEQEDFIQVLLPVLQSFIVSSVRAECETKQVAQVSYVNSITSSYVVKQCAHVSLLAMTLQGQFCTGSFRHLSQLVAGSGVPSDLRSEVALSSSARALWLELFAKRVFVVGHSSAQDACLVQGGS